MVSSTDGLVHCPERRPSAFALFSVGSGAGFVLLFGFSSSLDCLGSQTLFPLVKHQEFPSIHTGAPLNFYIDLPKTIICADLAVMVTDGPLQRILSLISECGPATAASSVFPPLQLWSLPLSDYTRAPCSHFITGSLMQDNVGNCLTEQFITWWQPFHHAGFREAYSGLTVPY